MSAHFERQEECGKDSMSSGGELECDWCHARTEDWEEKDMVPEGWYHVRPRGKPESDICRACFDSLLVRLLENYSFPNLGMEI